MHPSKARFVTACQQLLAIGVVLAALGPATDVISLDVVGTQPGSPVDAIAEQPSLTRLPGTPADRRGAPVETSRVETAPVEPAVTEVPLEPEQAPVALPPTSASEEAGESQGKTAPQRPGQDDARAFVSDPERVAGFGTVGVTWEAGQEISDESLQAMVRTRTGDMWSAWTPLEYHDEHGPDVDSPEAERARPGTDPLIVGDVDEVQAKVVTTDGTTPADLALAVVDPGRSDATAEEAAAIDTSKLDNDGTPTGAGTSEPLETDQGAIALQAGSFTPKPQIYSRAQWGANESLRDGSPSYYEVHAGFVHHTVNANDYTRDQVPGIIRSIYAYHTKTRGWSDIGYNFLVDRFGRIWEGRYGGVDRPVVGAHTMGYNEYSFAMSAIGNFETARPSSAMLTAYGQLFAWKLSLHGISAMDPSQRVGKGTFPAINGHRDAGSTACPGRYLYAKLPEIRTLAAAAQADWTGRDRATSVVGAAYPDILVRRTSDKRAFAIPTHGMLKLRSGIVTGTGYSRYDAVVASPDLTGDGKSDLLVRNASGVAGVRAGDGAGGFASSSSTTSAFSGRDQIAAVGDLNADGRNDVVARKGGTGKLHLFRGRAGGAFDKVLLSEAWAGYTLTAGVGDLNGDRLSDVVARDSAGRLWLHPGTGAARLGARVQLPGAWNGYDVITGFGDFTADGYADIFARAASTGYGYVFPGRGGASLGQPIGPLTGVKQTKFLSGAPIAGSAEPDLIGVRDDNLRLMRHSGLQNTRPAVALGSMFSDADTLLNVGDWDRDGHGDIVTRQAGTGALRLHRGIGGDKFAAATQIGAGWSGIRLLSAVGDVTGDGWPDLMGQPKGGALRIWPGRGASGFASSFVARSAVTASAQVGVGRWNADGAPDSVFRVDNTLTWQAGNGPGGLTGSRASLGVDVTAYDWVLGVGDVDGNGRPDLVVRERTTGYLWLLPGTGTGFATRRFLADGFAGYDLAG